MESGIMKKLRLVEKQNRSPSRTRGDLLFSALTFLILAGVLVTGQLMYYYGSAVSNSNIVQQNEAQAMKNMAIANDIKNGQQFEFNLGQAKRKGQKCIVTLKNQRNFDFFVEEWQTSKKN